LRPSKFTIGERAKLAVEKPLWQTIGVTLYVHFLSLMHLIIFDSNSARKAVHGRVLLVSICEMPDIPRFVQLEEQCKNSKKEKGPNTDENPTGCTANATATLNQRDRHFNQKVIRPTSRKTHFLK
jgi:hypothetical protein